MTTPRILLVEDEFLIRLTLTEALSDDGFDVIEAGSGDEALAMIGASERLDLLLTDIQLPGRTNGRALARAAREHAPDLPVIFMSGRPDDEGPCAEAARELYINKPYLPSDVCAAVRRLTNRPRP
jgi:CheY-like chemotaxis protein